MSCWRSYTCDVLKNVDKEIVEEALKALGVELDTTKNEVYGTYEKRSSHCDGVLVKNGHAIDVGIIFDDDTGHLQIIGDFWGTGLDAMEFQDNLSQTYQKINIMHQAELNGWTIDEDATEIKQDGSIEMEIYAYA